MPVGLYNPGSGYGRSGDKRVSRRHNSHWVILPVSFSCNCLAAECSTGLLGARDTTALLDAPPKLRRVTRCSTPEMPESEDRRLPTDEADLDRREDFFGFGAFTLAFLLNDDFRVVFDFAGMFGTEWRFRACIAGPRRICFLLARGTRVFSPVGSHGVAPLGIPALARRRNRYYEPSTLALRAWLGHQRWRRLRIAEFTATLFLSYYSPLSSTPSHTACAGVPVFLARPGTAAGGVRVEPHALLPSVTLWQAAAPVDRMASRTLVVQPRWVLSQLAGNDAS